MAEGYAGGRQYPLGTKPARKQTQLAGCGRRSGARGSVGRVGEAQVLLLRAGPPGPEGPRRTQAALRDKSSGAARLSLQRHARMRLKGKEDKSLPSPDAIGRLRPVLPVPAFP